MSKHIIKKMLTKPGPMIFVAFLVLFVLFLGKLSSFGFALSNYLAMYPLVSHVAAWIFTVIGFLACYLNLTFYASWTFNRAIRIYFFAALGMSGIYYMVSVAHFGCFSLPEDISTSPSIVDFLYFKFIVYAIKLYNCVFNCRKLVQVNLQRPIITYKDR